VKLSKRGLQMIAGFEGFRARAYNDPADPPNATIGFGHMLHRGPITHADWKLIWTREHALKVLRKDAKWAEDCVRRHVKVKLNQDQFDALVSFAFNCGCNAFLTSTLRRKLNAGNYAAVPAELMRWTKAGNRELEGLKIRRAHEARLFSRKPKRQKPLRTQQRIGRTHFTWEEVRSKDGKQVPLHLRPNVIRHAKNLEKLRTAVNVARAKRGLKPTGLKILSWYRSPQHNEDVGGASKSRHMKGDATDIAKGEITRLCPWPGGRDTFEASADHVFREGGFGQYPAGSRHVDSRGYKARWKTWSR
jgi:GH24 family phage-related lysozyme (muramidase)